MHAHAICGVGPHACQRQEHLPPAVLEAVDAIIRDMPTGEVTPLPGVEATLEVLATRHTLGLVTRGDPAEQMK